MEVKPMTEKAAKHTWVDIHRVVLKPGQRAPQVPNDTQQVPLEMAVKGFLVHDATIGEEVEIVTQAGRTLKGTLTAINPAYTHTFGAPIAELSAIGNEVRAMLNKRETLP
jgi:hypothetical protein